jgi:hypothetical protein
MNLSTFDVLSSDFNGGKLSEKFRLPKTQAGDSCGNAYRFFARCLVHKKQRGVKKLSQFSFVC